MSESSVDPQRPARLLEVCHVAHRLSASHEFVRRLLREHELPGIQIRNRWRIDPHDLDAYLAAHRTQLKKGRVTA